MVCNEAVRPPRLAGPAVNPPRAGTAIFPVSVLAPSTTSAPEQSIDTADVIVAFVSVEFSRFKSLSTFSKSASRRLKPILLFPIFCSLLKVYNGYR